MATLQSGQTISIQLAEGESYTVTPSGTAQVSTRGVSGSELSAPRTFGDAQTFGPYTEAGAISIACLSGTVDYTQAGGAVYQDPTTGALVGAGGAEVSTVRLLAQSAVPIPHTGTTAATLLATITVPGKSMGPNGALRITVYWSMTNNANSKNLVIRFGGAVTQFWSAGLASVAAAGCQIMIHNRGAVGSQIGNAGGTVGSLGTLPAMVLSSENTDVDQNIELVGNLTNSADTLTVERFTVELLR